MDGDHAVDAAGLAWDALAGHMRARREQLQLSTGQMERRGGVGPESWRRFEAGGPPQRVYLPSLRKIERALGWVDGTVLRILRGEAKGSAEAWVAPRRSPVIDADALPEAGFKQRYERLRAQHSELLTAKDKLQRQYDALAKQHTMTCEAFASFRQSVGVQDRRTREMRDYALMVYQAIVEEAEHG